MPSQASKLAVAYLNSMACNAGRLDTKSRRRARRPLRTWRKSFQSWPAPQGRQVGRGLPSDTPIYAAVLRGYCQSRGEPTIQGYVLFDDQGVLFLAGLEQGFGATSPVTVRSTRKRGPVYLGDRS